MKRAGQLALSIVLSQLISLLLTGTGVFSDKLASEGLVAPVTQSSLNYVLLAGYLLCAGPRACREGLVKPWWCYLLWAVLDVEANFLVVSAYKYTSIASVFLLDSFAIPVAMALARAALGARYTRWHMLACGVCLSGLLVTVLSDSAGQGGAATGLKGDLLVLAGATLYGVSNTFEQWLLKDGPRRSEALGMLGLFGSLISAVQALALERQAVASFAWSADAVGHLLGFQLCLFSMYSLTSVFLQLSDAVVFNMGNLTSDFFAVLFAWKSDRRRISWGFLAGFALTVSGLLAYYLQPPAGGGRLLREDSPLLLDAQAPEAGKEEP